MIGMMLVDEASALIDDMYSSPCCGIWLIYAGEMGHYIMEYHQYHDAWMVRVSQATWPLSYSKCHFIKLCRTNGWIFAYSYEKSKWIKSIVWLARMDQKPASPALHFISGWYGHNVFLEQNWRRKQNKKRKRIFTTKGKCVFIL